MTNKKLVTWKEIENYVDKVVEDIRSKNLKPTGVFGVPRGGLILATMLSYKLNLPLLLNATADCIVVDDIADSGRTLLHFTNNDTQFNDYYVTTMFYHQRSMVKPDFWVYEKTDKWIEFPWEKVD